MMRDKCGGKKHIDGIGQNVRLVEKEKIKQKEESAGIKNKNVFFFFPLMFLLLMGQYCLLKAYITDSQACLQIF